MQGKYLEKKPKPIKLILKWAKKVRQTIEELGGTMPEDLLTLLKMI